MAAGFLILYGEQPQRQFKLVVVRKEPSFEGVDNGLKSLVVVIERAAAGVQPVLHNGGKGFVPQRQFAACRLKGVQQPGYGIGDVLCPARYPAMREQGA